MKVSRISAAGLFVTAAVMGAGMTSSAQAQEKAAKKSGGDMTFFVSSVGKGNGADLGGLEGADAHCQSLAKAAGAKATNWHAYLSTALPEITKETALTEKGETVPGRGDAVNTHDILTGSDPAGMYSTAGGDTTCGNWTKSAEGSAIVGHHDLQGLKDTRHMKSWNSSHGSRGCSQDQLKASGGAGLLYCFAAN